MQYGTSKPSGPWRFTISVKCEPRCPGCAEYLQPEAVVFEEGWAWCAVCVLMKLHCEPWIGVVLGNDSMHECSSIINGLRFYTPDVVGGEALTAYEHAEKLRELAALSVVEPLDSHVYIVTPAGMAAIEDCNLEPVIQTMEEIQAISRQD